MAIVIIGVGAAGLMTAFSTLARRSADPQVARQMSAIAGELMEEVLLKPFATEANSAPVACARDTYNDVRDYHGYSATGICTIDGVAISELSAYSVAVSVSATALSTAADALRIVVTVTRGSDTLQLVGWRTNYGS